MATLPPIASYQSGNDAPWTKADVVAPHDSNDLPYHSRGIYVGTAGDVAVTMSSEEDNTATGKRIFPNVPVGFLPITVRRIWATGTAADDILCGT